LKGILVHGPSLSQFFHAHALPLAKGTNIVNTILVDFRGLDTLGEIAVIVVSALGVSALYTSSRAPLTAHFRSLIPTPMLAAVMPLLFCLAVVFAGYLLLRGHDEPGGGFVGGMVVAISFVLLGMAVRQRRFFLLDHIAPLSLMMLGLAFATAAAVLPLIFKEGFMVAAFWKGSTLFSTPFLFDLGVFLLIIGAVTAIIFVLRSNTLQGGRK